MGKNVNISDVLNDNQIIVKEITTNRDRHIMKPRKTKYIRIGNTFQNSGKVKKKEK